MTTNEAQQIGRIEAKVDMLLDAMRSTEVRVVRVEVFVQRAKGILALLVLLSSIAVAFATTGCATTKTACSMKFPDGTSYKGIVRTTIVGKGTADNQSYGNACGGFTSNTSDTGFSDNSVEIIDNAVKAGIAGASPLGAGAMVLDGE